MSLIEEHTPSKNAGHNGSDPRLPLRWALLLSISGVCGIAIGRLEGLPEGLIAFCTSLALLYQVVRDR